MLDQPGRRPPTSLGVFIFFVSILLYLINDLLGLSFIKRVLESRDISWRIMNGVIVSIFLQFVVQLFLAYGLFQAIRAFSPRGEFSLILFTKGNMQLSFIMMALFIVLFSGFINLYATIRLLMLAWANQKENKEVLENIGSEK
jgi:hypothetical protein